MHSDTLILLFWTVLVFWVTAQIWFAQIVIYPLFAKVGAAEYTGYHRFYSRRIPLVVILPGFASFLLPLPMAIFLTSVPFHLHVANMTAGVIGLLVTLGLEIPRHYKLEMQGKNAKLINELVHFNWPRTASMTIQAIVALLMLSPLEAR